MVAKTMKALIVLILYVVLNFFSAGLPTSSGFYLGFFVWGKSILKNVLSHTAERKKFFRSSRGSGGMLPRKILKR